ncbi:hypothetical protein G6F32_015256 [Rhizopus arrhizus]|nr:hypothetical protein G6F32_015256 [Rhizopus arrhizus]
MLDIRTHNTAVSQFLDNLLKLKATMMLAPDGEDDPEYAAETLGLPLTDYLWAIEYEKQRVDVFGYVDARGFFDATYDLARLLRSSPDARHDLPRYKLPWSAWTPPISSAWATKTRSFIRTSARTKRSCNIASPPALRTAPASR